MSKNIEEKFLEAKEYLHASHSWQKAPGIPSKYLIIVQNALDAFCETIVANTKNDMLYKNFIVTIATRAIAYASQKNFENIEKDIIRGAILTLRLLGLESIQSIKDQEKEFEEGLLLIENECLARIKYNTFGRGEG